MVSDYFEESFGITPEMRGAAARDRYAAKSAKDLVAHMAVDRNGVPWCEMCRSRESVIWT